MVVGNVMDQAGDDATREWVTLGEFARRLGITRGSVYGRIRRGTVESRRKGNKGFEVRWPPPNDHHAAGNGSGNGWGNGDGNRGPNVALDDAPNAVAMRVEIARLEERLSARDALLAERDARIADLQAALIEARRPWWRRLVG
jgi:hypothetical protein